MNGLAWTAAGLIAAGFAALRYGDRIRIAIEVRQFRRDLAHPYLAEVARIEEEMDETRREIRERRGEGGDA